MTNESADRLFDVLSRTFVAESIAIRDRNGRLLRSRPEPWIEGELIGPFVELIPLQQGMTLLIGGAAVSKEEAEAVGRMAKSLAALEEEKDHLAERINLLHDENASLINRLFAAATPESVAYIAMLGIDRGYDLSLPRSVCLFSPTIGKTNTTTKGKANRAILNALRRSEGFSSQDLFAQINDRSVVLCKSLEEPKTGGRAQLHSYLASICDYLKKEHGLAVRVGIGSTPKGIAQFGGSLLEAQDALKFGLIFKRNNLICDIAEYTFELEISRMPQDVLEHFFGKKARLLASTAFMDQTVEALVMHNMDIAASAAYLGVHRSTIVFRLNRIKKRLELDPLHSDSDRFALIALYIYRKLSRP